MTSLPRELTQEHGQGEWRIVTRRRRPPHFLPDPHSPPKQAKLLNPLSPTYAQILQTKPSQPPPKTPQTVNSVTSHSDQPNPSKIKLIESPHSPISLRYPPSPHFQEWWGRCFRCAQKGHIVAGCNFPRTVPVPPKTIPSTDKSPHAATSSPSVPVTVPNLFIPRRELALNQLLMTSSRNPNHRTNPICPPTGRTRPSATSTETASSTTPSASWLGYSCPTH